METWPENLAATKTLTLSVSGIFTKIDYLNTINKPKKVSLLNIMAKCTISNKKVTWFINKELIDDMFYNDLLHKKKEYSGKLIFENTSDCSDEGICNKYIKDIITKVGEKDSVVTPLAVINFHTHPKSCYIDEGVKWGWPSGEDMRECLNFAKHKNFCHHPGRTNIKCY